MIEPRIILLEDDEELRSIVGCGLREEGFAVSMAGSAAELVRHVDAGDAEALIIDIGLPDADGRDVVQALRARGVGTPVIFLTARDALPVPLAGFASGGDDYLTKPFHFAELVARLQALIRRGGSETAIEAGGMRLDPRSHDASCGGRNVKLTPTEFRILARLARHPVMLSGDETSCARRGPMARSCTTTPSTCTSPIETPSSRCCPARQAS